MELMDLAVCTHVSLRTLIIKESQRSEEMCLVERMGSQCPGTGVAGSTCVNKLQIITKLCLPVLEVRIYFI